MFGGPAWNPVGDGQFYLGIFSDFQPDFNWENPEVIEDFHETLRFWGNRGVSGFRVDVANGLAKDLSGTIITQAEMDKLKNGGPQPDGGSHPIWDRDEVQDIYKGWRKVFNEFDPPLTYVSSLRIGPDRELTPVPFHSAVAEAWVPSERKARYASSEGLGQTFSFDMLTQEYGRDRFKKCIDHSLADARKGRTSTTWVLSNHDVSYVSFCT